MARKHGVEELLPWSPKLSWVKEEKKELRGLRVKGTGVGQRVKGHLWERTMKGRLEERRQAMRAMPELIREWKQKGHGRGWKKWPK
jgi:large subunit ribosomal protein L25